MPMTSSRLQPMLRLADTREQDALRRLAESQGQLGQQEAKLVELQQYLEDYLQRDHSGSIGLVMNHQAFVARLREAEQCQQRVVEQARRAYDTERAHWMAQRQDLGVLNQLDTSCRRREQHHHEKRAQLLMDEAAGLRYTMQRMAQSAV